MVRTSHPVLRCLAVGALLCSAAAQAWEPTRPIQLVVGFTPGGGTDAVARAFSLASVGHLPVPVVVVNKPGAAGTLAAESVVASKGDGYTLMIGGGSESTVSPHATKVKYSLASFKAIANLVRLRVVLVAPASGPAKTFEQYVAYAKAHPGKVSFGTSGPLSQHQVSMVVLNRSAGIETTPIPFKGDSESLVAMLGGQIDAAFMSPDQVQAYAEDGRIRILAINGDARWDQMPGVPTFKELGITFPIDNLKGVMAPATIPAEIYDYYALRIKQVYDSDAFKAALKRFNVEGAYMDGPTFEKNLNDISDTVKAAIAK